MTLSTQLSKTAFAGNGVTSVFPLPFPFIRENDIRALLRQDGRDTPLLPGTHYSLEGAGSPAGGSLSLGVPPATGQTLVVWRVPAIVQEVDYVENAAFPAETHEAALDLLTMICQSLQEQIDRAVLYPVSTPAEDILDSEEFLEATAANKLAAQAAQLAAQTAAQAASASAASAQASAATADALAGGGTVRVSTGDAQAQSLSAKLLAGNGLSETIENPGAAEALRLAVALAENPGLEFSGGLLRVKAGAGLTLGANGLAADVGASAGKLVQLDSSGKLPALDASRLTGIATGDAQARDLAVMNAFLAQTAAGRASGPVPGGYLHLFATDELPGKDGAYYDSVNKLYSNFQAVTPVPGGTGTPIGTGTNLATAFDGVTNVQNVNGSVTMAAIGYTGKDWGAGNSKIIQSAVYYASTNYGFYYTGAGNAAIQLLASNTNDPATATVLGSVSVANASGASATVTSSSTTAYRYHWMSCTGPGASQINCSEIVFNEMFPPANATLVPAAVAAGAAPAHADLYLLHRAVDAVALNTDLKAECSADGGATWAFGTLTALCDYDASFKLLKASVALPTSGTSIKWRITSHNQKSQQWRGVAALLR